MKVDFFTKGQGFKFLQEVYSLTDDQIKRIRSKVYYFYHHKPLRKDEINQYLEILRMYGEEAEVQDWMINPKSGYELVDDAVEIFLSETGLKIDTIDLSDLQIRCVHVSPTIDGAESIKTYGLIKLTELLQNPTPLRGFLADEGIVVNPDEHTYSVDGEERSIDGTGIGIKLYSTNSEIEAFITGEISTLTDYSCIEDAPEILREIGQATDKDLIQKWALKKQGIAYVSFDVSFDECANITRMAILKDEGNLQRLLPYCERQYDFGMEPVSIWRNYWFILACLDNACPDKRIERDYMALKSEIGPERINVEVKEGVYNDILQNR